VEQRIGRCHRYGQKYDVVVVNFCNVRNAADVRVYELLSNKFRLFEGIFGASNDVLGIIDGDGITFEKRISSILSLCRTAAEINAQFDRLQEELQEEIAQRRAEAQQAVFENLDEEVRKFLKVDPLAAKTMLSSGESRFMTLTRHLLQNRAVFDPQVPQFTLEDAPTPEIPKGLYVLKGAEATAGAIPYRPNTLLGEWAITSAKDLATPLAEITFDISSHAGKIFVLDQLKGESGILTLERMTLKSLDAEDYLLFSALTDEGKPVEAEIAEKFFSLGQSIGVANPLTEEESSHLVANAKRYADAEAQRVGETNNEYFKEALDKIERWAEDQVSAAEHKIEVLKDQQREIRRKIRLARTLDEQAPLQKEEQRVGRLIRQARNNVFAVEDETDAKREDLIKSLQRKLVPEIAHEALFTIRWKVI